MTRRASPADSSAATASMKQVRAVAARLRAGERPEVSPDMLARAEALLRHRASYNARRTQVRTLAAQVRAGRKPRAPAEILVAVERHLAYRDWYNEDRRNKRRTVSQTGAHAGRPRS